MAESHFFQAFFGPQNKKQQINSNSNYITYNETVLEIYNNWEYVVDLIKRYNERKLEQVDQMEHLWYNFIVSNNINIMIYKNKEEFLSAFWKKI